MIKLRKRGSLIVISGPSGAGKDSIVEKLLEKRCDLWLSVSCTSREVRGVEKEGVDYFFISKEEFEEKISNDEFLEYALYNGKYYGTLKSNVEEKLNEGFDVVLVIEVQGALKVKKMIDDAIFVFIMPPSMKELKQRLVDRGTETREKIFNRFKISYQEINEFNKYNYVVVNDILDDAVHKVNSILISEKCRADRIEEMDVHNIEEVMHEELIDMNIED